MAMLLIAIPISVLLTLMTCAGFYWACRRNQFDNLEYEASRILFDEND